MGQNGLRNADGRGLIWKNPASGYLQRDSGMPLDNMNNNVRIFLGTRIGCAQCHDHPFDKWTQKEFYQMAAFTYGTLTSTHGNDKRYWDSNPDDRLQASTLRSSRKKKIAATTRTDLIALSAST